MSVPVKKQDLAERMRRQRVIEGLTLREAAAKAHVSLGTYYRAEKEAKGVPDLATLLGICGWLGIAVEDVVEQHTNAKALLATQRERSTPEMVEAHLRADKRLRPETAKALADVFKAAYERFAAEDKP